MQARTDVGRTEQDHTTLLTADSFETEQLIQSTLATTAAAKSQVHMVKTVRKNDGQIKDGALTGSA